MNREIKYRAWNGKEMIYNVTPFKWDFVLTTSAWKCIKSNGKGMMGSGGTEATFEVCGYSFKELMQSPGLKDKNGKEIYEGDIVKATHFECTEPTGEITELKEVKYEITEGRSALWTPLNYIAADHCEVIGNIYENPELLTEK